MLTDLHRHFTQHTLGKPAISGEGYSGLLGDTNIEEENSLYR